MLSKYYKNKKNGKRYVILRDDLINCTNKDDGKIMVLYHPKDGDGKIFVREIEEFLEKFEVLPE